MVVVVSGLWVIVVGDSGTVVFVAVVVVVKVLVVG